MPASPGVGGSDGIAFLVSAGEGFLAGVIMYASYLHARSAGLASAQPGTETDWTQA